MHEQEILSEIQDLQQRLWRLQSGGSEDVPQEAYQEHKTTVKAEADRRIEPAAVVDHSRRGLGRAELPYVFRRAGDGVERRER